MTGLTISYCQTVHSRAQHQAPRGLNERKRGEEGSKSQVLFGVETPMISLWLGHTLQATHRLDVDELLGVTDEEHTVSGISHRMDCPHEFAMWLFH